MVGNKSIIEVSKRTSKARLIGDKKCEWSDDTNLHGIDRVSDFIVDGNSEDVWKEIDR